MKFGVGALFVVLGLLVLWLAVTGRLSNMEQAWAALIGKAAGPAKPASWPGGTTGNPMSTALEDRLGIPSGFPGLPTLGFGERSGMLA